MVSLLTSVSLCCPDCCVSISGGSPCPLPSALLLRATAEWVGKSKVTGRLRGKSAPEVDSETAEASLL